jgi:alkanesulfonate monooxygenase SsuD/methylene tetrahydromethanopterin reductase-like flavin-dependent oxidoreductase (luciferase family)
MGRPPALAVTVPQYRAEAASAVAACLDARRLGFAGAFLFDHLWPLGGPRTRPALECWTLLAALAARVGPAAAPLGGGPGGLKPSPPADGLGFRLGTLVTRAGLRPPALVARMAATAGEAAGVPLIVGVGGGDASNRAENLAFGLPYPDAAGRSAAVAATVATLRAPVAGRARPAVWVGGNGPTGRALAGRLADAWNGWARTPEELAAGLADARRAAADAGRDPTGVAATWGGQVLVGEDQVEAARLLDRWGSDRPPEERARVVAGDPETVLARLTELGEAGASWCVLALVAGSAGKMRSRVAAAAGLDARLIPGEKRGVIAEE